jgi:hypothetical protein
MTTISKDGYSIYKILINAGFSDQYARFITAQGAHETDNFSSDIYKNNLNPFGMTYQGQKEAEGEKDGYAYYLNWGQAVQDYKRLFKSWGFVSLDTLTSFVKLLQKKGYFTALYADYLKGCTWFYNLYFPKNWTPEKTKIAGAGGSW